MLIIGVEVWALAARTRGGGELVGATWKEN
jgi:hypothetical protein